MEKGRLEEPEEAGVTPINRTGAAAAVVVAVLAIGRPRVEFGMMAMTFVSSVNQGAHPGHYAFLIFKYRNSISS